MLLAYIYICTINKTRTHTYKHIYIYTSKYIKQEGRSLWAAIQYVYINRENLDLLCDIYIGTVFDLSS